MQRLLSCAAMILIAFHTVVPNVQDSVASKQMTDKEAHVRKVIETLDPLNPLRVYLEHGERGNGIKYEWMDEMQKLGIKHAAYIISFVWDQGNITARVTDVSYHPKYYQYDVVVSDPDVLNRLVSSGLEKKLRDEAISRAKRMIPGHIHKPSQRTCGKIYVNLLDDETLPVLNDIPDVDSDCKKDKEHSGSH